MDGWMDGWMDGIVGSVEEAAKSTKINPTFWLFLKSGNQVKGKHERNYRILHNIKNCSNKDTYRPTEDGAPIQRVIIFFFFSFYIFFPSPSVPRAEARF
jgi:hypothetical protein